MSDTRRPITEGERRALMRLGVAVRRHRTRAGLTQAELAARVGVHEDTIERIERGKRRTRRATVEAIALACAEERNVQPAPIVRALLGASEGLLASESPYQERVDARRLRRYRRDGNRHRQRQREATRTMLRALSQLMDGVLWYEYAEGKRDKLPAGVAAPAVSPSHWLAMFLAAERTSFDQWREPTLSRVIARKRSP